MISEFLVGLIATTAVCSPGANSDPADETKRSPSFPAGTSSRSSDVAASTRYAVLGALKDGRMRGRLSYGTWQGGPPADQNMDLADLARMQREWRAQTNDGLLTLGMASRSISNSLRDAATMDAIRRDWAGARSLGLPITIHTGGLGTIAALDREELLGPDVQLVHSDGWDAENMAIVARSGAHVSTSPLSELRIALAAFARVPQARLPDVVRVIGRCVHLINHIGRPEEPIVDFRFWHSQAT